MKSMLARKAGKLRYYIYPGVVRSYHISKIESVKEFLDAVLSEDFKAIITPVPGTAGLYNIEYHYQNGEDQYTEEGFYWTDGQKDYVTVPVAKCKRSLF